MAARTLSQIATIPANLLHNPQQTNPYASYVSPVECTIMDRHYQNGLANDAAKELASNLIGVNADGYYVPSDGVVSEWTPAARAAVSFTHKGMGLFSRFSQFSKGTKADEKRLIWGEYPDYSESIGYLPLIRVNVADVFNGKARIVHSVLFVVTASAFFDNYGIVRRVTPNMDRLQAFIVRNTGKVRADGTAVTERETLHAHAIEVLIGAWGQPQLLQIMADQLQSVMPYVVDRNGGSVNVKNVASAVKERETTAKEQQITGSLAVEIANVKALGLPTDLENAAINAVIAKFSSVNTTVQTVTAPQLPPAFDPAAMFAHRPSNVDTVPSANNDAPKVKNAATAGTPNKTARQNEKKYTAREIEAIALAEKPSKKSRESNQKIVNNLPDTWIGKNGQTAKQRRQQAQDQL